MAQPAAAPVAAISTANGPLAKLLALPEHGGLTHGSPAIADWTPVMRGDDGWMTSTGENVPDELVISLVWVAPDRTRAVVVIDQGCGDSCHLAAMLVTAAGMVRLAGDHPSDVAWRPDGREVAVTFEEAGRSKVATFALPLAPGKDLDGVAPTMTFERFSAPAYRADGTLEMRKQKKVFARAADGSVKPV
jgi:hypothetical protein